MDTRTRPARKMSQLKAHLKPSQMRRRKLKRRETMRRPKRKKSPRPTALRRRPERRPRQSPRHLRRRRRRLLRVLGRAPASLVAPNVALLRRARRRKLRQRRPKVGRSDHSPSFTLAPAICLCFHSSIASQSCTISPVSFSFLSAKHSSLWT